MDGHVVRMEATAEQGRRLVAMGRTCTGSSLPAMTSMFVGTLPCHETRTRRGRKHRQPSTRRRSSWRRTISHENMASRATPMVRARGKSDRITDALSPSLCLLHTYLFGPPRIADVRPGIAHRLHPVQVMQASKAGRQASKQARQASKASKQADASQRSAMQCNASSGALFLAHVCTSLVADVDPLPFPFHARLIVNATP